MLWKTGFDSYSLLTLCANWCGPPAVWQNFKQEQVSPTVSLVIGARWVAAEGPDGPRSIPCVAGHLHQSTIALSLHGRCDVDGLETMSLSLEGVVDVPELMFAAHRRAMRRQTGLVLPHFSSRS